VLGYIDKGVAEGAKLLVDGADARGGSATGYFVGPTVFDDVSPKMSIGTTRSSDRWRRSAR
jgi:malonate-semialdehyde dehydrogenase (acetylating)/methylmalonate-semialdehyde dehydrogenase